MPLSALLQVFAASETRFLELIDQLLAIAMSNELHPELAM